MIDDNCYIFIRIISTTKTTIKCYHNSLAMYKLKNNTWIQITNKIVHLWWSLNKMLSMEWWKFDIMMNHIYVKLSKVISMAINIP